MPYVYHREHSAHTMFKVPRRVSHCVIYLAVLNCVCETGGFVVNAKAEPQLNVSVM